MFFAVLIYFLRGLSHSHLASRFDDFFILFWHYCKRDRSYFLAKKVTSFAKNRYEFRVKQKST
nr:MAG TPA: hypothetical protein [Caudoviricetes sp.]